MPRRCGNVAEHGNTAVSRNSFAGVIVGAVRLSVCPDSGL